jgi:hypothetical protein
MSDRNVRLIELFDALFATTYKHPARLATFAQPAPGPTAHTLSQAIKPIDTLANPTLGGAAGDRFCACLTQRGGAAKNTT